MNIIVKELFSLISILGNKFFVAMLVNTLHRQLMHFPAVFGLFWALFAYFWGSFWTFKSKYLENLVENMSTE